MGEDRNSERSYEFVNFLEGVELKSPYGKNPHPIFVRLASSATKSSSPHQERGSVTGFPQDVTAEDAETSSA